MHTDASSQSWHCFDHGGPPDAVIAGVRTLLGLPAGAQSHLWHLIRVGLEEAEAPDHRTLLDSYAMRFEANPAHLLAAVRTCQFLLRQAAARRVTQADFVSDLSALSGGSAGLGELLTPHYARVTSQLRLKLLEDTLADHGNVLVGFDWRIDAVKLSNHGALDGVPVVFMNLAYRRGDKTERLSLQLSPSAIASLKAFWERFETTP
jgi:hypothetical protein